MWTRDRILDDLRELRILPGDSLIVHGSLRAIGSVEGGVDAVIDALVEAVGPEGTIMAPAFAPSEGHHASPDGTVVDAENPEVLAEQLLRYPGSKRSAHCAFSFSATGRNAEFLTTESPFHFPLGANSPLARLYQLQGGVLLLGVGHEANVAIHLAEAWADAPYGRRKTAVLTENAERVEMQGGPACRRGFPRIEPVLRQARILRQGYVGNAPSQYMRIQYVVTMAIEMLRGDPESLLCDDTECAECRHARTFTREQRPLDRKVL